MTAWQLALGVYLVLVGLTHFGVPIPALILGIGAVVAAVLVLLGR